MYVCSICLLCLSAKQDGCFAIKSCGHVFHSECINRALASHEFCPNCRGEIQEKSEELIRIYFSTHDSTQSSTASVNDRSSSNDSPNHPNIEVEDLINHLNELTATRDSLIDEKNLLDQQLTEMEAASRIKISRLELKIQDLRNANQTHEQKVQTLNAQLQEKIRSNTQLSTELSNTKTALQVKSNELNNEQQKLADSIDSCKQLQDNIIQMGTDLQLKVSEVNDLSRDKLENQRIIEDLRSNLAGRESKVTELQGQIRDREQQIEELNNTVLEKGKELELLASKISEKQSEIEQLTIEHNEDKDLIEAREQENINLTEQLNKSDQENYDLRKQLDEKNQENEVFKELLNNSNDLVNGILSVQRNLNPAQPSISDEQPASDTQQEDASEKATQTDYSLD